MKVAVCGLPRSGNRIIREMLRLHGVDAEVRHYGMERDFRTGGPPELAVLPVRDYEPWRLSCLRDWSVLPKPATGGKIGEDGELHKLIADHYAGTVRLLAGEGVLVLPVRYESIVQFPVEQGARILRFCRGPRAQFLGWGQPIRDGNEKWSGGRGPSS